MRFPASQAVSIALTCLLAAGCGEAEPGGGERLSGPAPTGRAVDCLLDGLADADVVSPLLAAESLAAVRCDLAALPEWPDAGNGQRAFLLPTPVERRSDGSPGPVLLIAGGEPREAPVAVAGGEEEIRIASLEGFKDFRVRKDVLQFPVVLVDRESEVAISVRPLALRLAGTLVLGAEGSGAAAPPQVRVRAGGETLVETPLRRGSQRLDFEIPEGATELTVELLGVRAEAAGPRAALRSLELRRDDGRDRLLVPADLDLKGVSAHYAPRQPPVVLELLGEGVVGSRELRREVHLAVGRTALAGPSLGAAQVALAGALVAEGDAEGGGELAFEVLEAGPAELRVTAEAPLRGPLWLVQPTLSHARIRDPGLSAGRTLGPLRGVESFSDFHPLQRHVIFRDHTRRCLLLSPGSEVALPVHWSAGDALELAVAATRLEASPLPVPGLVLEVVERPGSGAERVLAAIPTGAPDTFGEQHWTTERALDGHLVLRVLRDERRPVACGEWFVAVAEPRIVRQHPARRPPNVLIYLIDTLRADHLSCYGYERPTTPNLDALAEDGVLFEQAYSQCSWTRPSVATLMTGLLPWFHRSRKGVGLDPELETLAERAREQGMETAGFIANYHVHGPTLNFEQGFSLYEAVETRKGGSRASDVNAVILPWLDRHGDRPFFLYVHTIDPHATYDPPPQTAGRFQSGDYRGAVTPDQTRARSLRRLAPLSPEDLQQVLDLYDEEILFNDREFGRLVQKLKDGGLYENTTIVVLSDHGEEFQEHGHFGHDGLRLWEEQLRVPLIVKLAGSERPRGVRVRDRVRVLDVLPTLAEHLDWPAPALGYQGVDLAPRWGGTGEEPLDVIAEETGGQRKHEGGTTVRCLLRGEYKLIHRAVGPEDAPLEEQLQLYHLPSDPTEQTDLAGAQPERAAQYLEELRRILGDLEARGFRRAAGLEEREMSEEQLQALENMGYLQRNQP